MEAIISQAQDLVEGQIDFEGQRLTEIASTALLSITSVIALIVGFIQKDIYLALWIGLAGAVLTMLVVVPPWPFFNQYPQIWLGSKTSLPTRKITAGG